MAYEILSCDEQRVHSAAVKQGIPASDRDAAIMHFRYALALRGFAPAHLQRTADLILGETGAGMNGDRRVRPWALCSWRGDKASIVYTFKSHADALPVLAELRCRFPRTPYSIEDREILASRGVLDA